MSVESMKGRMVCSIADRARAEGFLPRRRPPTTLTLPVKRRWFEEIRAGRKVQEFRLVKPHWERRLVFRPYDFVEITLGYPKREDASRRLRFRYLGYTQTHVVSDEWGGISRKVYAIDLRAPLTPEVVHGQAWEAVRCCVCGAQAHPSMACESCGNLEPAGG